MKEKTYTWICRKTTAETLPKKGSKKRTLIYGSTFSENEVYPSFLPVFLKEGQAKEGGDLESSLNKSGEIEALRIRFETKIENAKKEHKNHVEQLVSEHEKESATKDAMIASFEENVHALEELLEAHKSTISELSEESKKHSCQSCDESPTIKDIISQLKDEFPNMKQVDALEKAVAKCSTDSDDSKESGKTASKNKSDGDDEEVDPLEQVGE